MNEYIDEIKYDGLQDLERESRYYDNEPCDGPCCEAK